MGEIGNKKPSYGERYKATEEHTMFLGNIEEMEIDRGNIVEMEIDRGGLRASDREGLRAPVGNQGTQFPNASSGT
ncbi:MAG: hypothetical protein GY739_20420 [Mesoflavibacter sp.]|nr:hypothetical protein [Mesoflavibacter sp.]